MGGRRPDLRHRLERRDLHRFHCARAAVRDGKSVLQGESVELGGRRIAMEVNLEIVPGSQYATYVLNEGDRVEVVHAIGGG